MKKYVLGLDNGGTVTKAVIFDLIGQEIASVKRKNKVTFPRPGYAECNMEELWRENCRCIQEVLYCSGIKGEEIISLAVCGHGKGLYLWGQNDRPAGPGILSSDNRAWKYTEKWKNDGSYEKIKNKICQNLMPSQQAALLAWMKEECPEIYGKIKYIFSVKDYIRFRLTGEAFSEMTDLSGSGLIDIIGKRKDQEILKAYGIEEVFDRIPPLKKSTDLCGQVTKKAAEDTGLLPGTPVAGGMFDIDACAVAANVLTPEYICMIAGTWSINEYISPAPVMDNNTGMNSLFALSEYYLIEESSPTSAGNLDWFYEIQEGKDRGDFYQEANAMAASVNPENCDIYFLPFLYGSNMHPLSKAAFVGLTSYHRMEHILRAVYEGVVYSHKYHIDRLLKRRDTPKSIRMAGGAVNSEIWIQMFADILGFPVETVKTKEMGALGCGITAAVSAGCYKDIREACKAMVKTDAVIYPDMRKKELYENKYQKYLSVCKALENVWSEFQI